VCLGPLSAKSGISAHSNPVPEAVIRALKYSVVIVKDSRDKTGSNELYGGIAVAVFVVVLVAFSVGCASLLVPYGLPRTSGDVNATFLIGFVTAFVTFPLAAISAIVVGIPLFRLWNHLGYTSLPQYLLAGVVISAILGTVVALTHFFAGFLSAGSDFSVALWIVAVGGPVAAITVRCVARLRAARNVHAAKPTRTVVR
jgi:hypothetical protein